MASKSATDTEWSDAEELVAHRAVTFKKKVEAGAAACARGDFQGALRLYAEAIALDPSNHVLYSNRSAIFCKLKLYEEAFRDAEKAFQLKPSWVKAFFRKGYSLKCMGRHIDALTAYAAGLALEPKNQQIISGFLECALESPLNEKLKVIVQQLKSLELDKSAYLLISVVGQELLSFGKASEAAKVLECAVQIGSSSLKLQQSVVSALSSAYWTLGKTDKALVYMKEHLSVAVALEDITSEMQAHENLGMAYAFQENQHESLCHYQQQLCLAQKVSDNMAQFRALSALGHLHSSLSDTKSALAAHEQCLQLMQEIPDCFGLTELAQKHGQIGSAYVALHEFDHALECFQLQLSLAEAQSDMLEIANALSNMGSLYLAQFRYNEAMEHLCDAVKMASDLKNRSLEGRLYGQLSAAARMLKNADCSQRWAQKQLQVALVANDKRLEIQACYNLGLSYFQLGNYESSLRLHQRQLELSKAAPVRSKNELARAYCSIGLNQSALGRFEEALKVHRQELSVCVELGDKGLEAVAHGNVAQCLIELGHIAQAEAHLNTHLELAQEVAVIASESCALLQLGRFHCEQKEYCKAVPFLERHLMLSQEQNDVHAERKACYLLGHSHFKQQHYREALHYYSQELALAKDLKDHATMAEAYNCLGLCHAAVGQLDESLDCQKFQLALAHITKNMSAKFKALTQIALVLGMKGNLNASLKVLGKQLTLSKLCQDKKFEATTYGALGEVYDKARFSDRALAYFMQELSLYEETCDLQGQVTAYGHIGACYKNRSDINFALKAFEQQALIAHKLGNKFTEAEAIGHSATVCVSGAMPNDAVSFLEQQIALLHDLTGFSDAVDKMLCVALSSLGSVLSSLGYYQDAIAAYARVFELVSSAPAELIPRSCSDRIRLEQGWAYLRSGQNKLALACFEACLQDVESCSNDALWKLHVMRAIVTCKFVASDHLGALAMLQQSLSFASANGVVSEQCSILQEIAFVGLRLNDLDRVLSCAQTALQISKANDAILDHLQALRTLTIIYIEKGIYDVARTILLQYSFALEDCVNSHCGENGSINKLKVGYFYLSGLLELLTENYSTARQQLNKMQFMAKELCRSVDEALSLELTGLLDLLDNNDIVASLMCFKSSFKCLSKLLHCVVVDGQRISELTNVNVMFCRITSFIVLLLVQQQLFDEALSFAERLRFHHFLAQREFFRTRNRKLPYVSDTRLRKELQSCLGCVGAVGVFSFDKYFLSFFFSSSGFVENCDVSCNKFASSRHDLKEQQPLGPEIELASYSFSALNSVVNSKLEQLFPPVLSTTDRVSLPSALINFLSRLNNTDQTILICSSDILKTIIDVHVSAKSHIREFRYLPFIIPPPPVSEELISDSTAIALNGRLAFCVTDSTDMSTVPEVDSLLNNLGSSSVLSLSHRESVLEHLSFGAFLHIVACYSHEKDAFMFSVASGDVSNDQDVERTVQYEYLSLEDLRALKTRCRAQLITLAPSQLYSNSSVGDMFLLNFASELLRLGARTVLVLIRNDHSLQYRQHYFSSLYRSLMQGMSILTAMTEAARHCKDTCALSEVPTSQQFVLVGRDDTKLINEKVSRLNEGFRTLLETPDDCREALRILLHLVEKALQRLNAGHLNAMYTSEQSIKNKIGPEAAGWCDVLEALGFRRDRVDGSSASSTEMAIYFPLSGPQAELAAGKRMLHVLLSLQQNTLVAFSKLTHNSSVVQKLLYELDQLLSSLTNQPHLHEFQTRIKASLYHVDGVHELFSALGFDLLHSEEGAVITKTVRVGLTKTNLQLAIEALHVVFDDFLTVNVKQLSAESLSSLNDHTDIPSYDRNTIFCPTTGASKLPSNNRFQHSLPRSQKPSCDANTVVQSSKTKIAKKVGKWNNNRHGRATNKSGYTSEGEHMSLSRSAVSRGYCSESESLLSSANSKSRHNDSSDVFSCSTANLALFERELIESTAKVISVDEHYSSLPESSRGYENLYESVMRCDVLTFGKSSVLRNSTPIASGCDSPSKIVVQGQPETYNQRKGRLEPKRLIGMFLPPQRTAMSQKFVRVPSKCSADVPQTFDSGAVISGETAIAAVHRSPVQQAINSCVSSKFGKDANVFSTRGNVTADVFPVSSSTHQYLELHSNSSHSSSAADVSVEENQTGFSSFDASQLRSAALKLNEQQQRLARITATKYSAQLTQLRQCPAAIQVCQPLIQQRYSQVVGQRRPQLRAPSPPIDSQSSRFNQTQDAESVSQFATLPRCHGAATNDHLRNQYQIVRGAHPYAVLDPRFTFNSLLDASK